MKAINKTLIGFVLLTTTLLSSCAVLNVDSDQDNTIDFKQYKTFAWYAKDPTAFKNNEFDNQIVESNIKNLVSAELKRRGYKVDIDSPDVLLDFDVMIEKKTDQQQVPVYSYPYNYGYYNPYRPNNYPYTYQQRVIGYQTQNIPYKDGTLTLSMIDRKTNRLVWRGWGEGVVTDVQVYESQLPKGIDEIFNKFPVKLISNHAKS